MQRRRFIRTVGGGIVAALGGLGTGCSADYPAASIAAWNGPPSSDEIRRWALGHAILAPSSHNRQPWRVDLREPDAIALHVDRTRLLPETDPWFRQIVVSQGTFLELLVIALRERGIEPRVELFPDGEFAPRTLDDRPVARVAWKPLGAPAQKDPLFAQILRRQTAKVDYEPNRPVEPRVLEALAGVVTPVDVLGVRFGASIDAKRLEALRQLCWDAARIELGTERTVMESVRLLRVGPGEITTHRDGISVNTPLLRTLDAVGLFDRSHAPTAGDAAFRNMLATFEGHSRSASGFVWLSTATAANSAAGRMRSAEVAAGRAYVRLQLKASELGLQVHPMSQALQEFAEMKPHYDGLHQRLLGKPADVETLQMFCRIGYAEPQQHTPRRGVAAIVRA